MHVVVFVIDGSNINTVSEQLIRKLKEVKDVVANKGNDNYFLLFLHVHIYTEETLGVI